MAYYYVKSGGIATGDAGRATSQRTGTFAAMGVSAYYDTVNAANAATTPPAAGDYVLISDYHAETGTVQITFAGPASGNALSYITVDNSNCENAAIASTLQIECTSSSADLAPEGIVYMYGLNMRTNDDFRNTGKVVMEHCTIDAVGTDDKVYYSTSDGASLYAKRCTYTGGTAIAAQVSSAGFVRFEECTFSGITDDLFSQGFGSGGGVVEVVGCDLSSFTGYLVADVGGDSVNDDTIVAIFRNCKINAAVGWNNEDFANYGQRLIATGCGSDSASEYQFHVTSSGGEADATTAFYRTDSTAFSSGAQVSIKCVTDSASNYARPFWFDFPTRHCALSSASSDVIRIYIMSATTLTDQDIWASAVYPDGTNIHVPNRVTTHVAPFVTGTTLATNTEAWTNRTTENRYQIDLDTSVDAGADGVPIIRVFIAKPSTTIYICPTIGLS